MADRARSLGPTFRASINNRSARMQSFPAAQLQGATLIVPVVAIGNTAQLSVDLLINTLQLQRVARLHDPSLLPAVGCKPYEHVPGLATAMELYQAAGSNVAVVQQRAAAAPGTQDAFGQSFAAFLKQSGVKEVGRDDLHSSYYNRAH